MKEKRNEMIVTTAGSRCDAITLKTKLTIKTITFHKILVENSSKPVRTPVNVYKTYMYEL